MNVDKKKKYITLEDGADFRKIADVMTDAGYKMNHATARNQLMLAMENLFTEIGRELNLRLNKEQISEMLRSQDVHDALTDILYLAHNNKQREE
ncbi:MAG: hypothetical protein WC761_01970 [Candidatus Paceibacterota bacterium]|jgi:cytidylate kinase